jgi:hypothetical protein
MSALIIMKEKFTPRGAREDVPKIRQENRRSTAINARSIAMSFDHVQHIHSWGAGSLKRHTRCFKRWFSKKLFSRYSNASRRFLKMGLFCRINPVHHKLELPITRRKYCTVVQSFVPAKKRFQFENSKYFLK